MNLFQKRITKEIQKYSKVDFKFDNFQLAVDPDNMQIWYFLVKDLDSPFKGGLYIGKLVLSDQYPLKPGDIIFLTDTGRFKTNAKICTTFSAFHPSSYSAALNVSTIVQSTISFMTDLKEQGIGSLILPEKQIQEIADKSKVLIKNCKEYKEYFAKKM